MSRQTPKEVTEVHDKVALDVLTYGTGFFAVNLFGEIKHIPPEDVRSFDEVTEKVV